jgi:hypothetical protein
MSAMSADRAAETQRARGPKAAPYEKMLRARFATIRDEEMEL